MNLHLKDRVALITGGNIGTTARVEDTPVPPSYLIRATNGFFTTGGDTLFTSKEAGCFPETASRFFYLPSATLLAQQEAPANPWRSRRCLHRHTRTLKRNPALFGPASRSYR